MLCRVAKITQNKPTRATATLVGMFQQLFEGGKCGWIDGAQNNPKR